MREKLIKNTESAWLSQLMSNNGVNGLASRIKNGGADALLELYDLGLPIAVGMLRERPEFIGSPEGRDHNYQEYLFGFNGLTPLEVRELVGPDYDSLARSAIERAKGQVGEAAIVNIELGQGVTYHSVVDTTNNLFPVMPGYGYASVPRISETGNSARTIVGNAVHSFRIQQASTQRK